MIILFVSLMLISACATAPPLTEAEINPGPFPENYEALIKEHINEIAFDPDSIRDLSIPLPKKYRLEYNFRRFNLRKCQLVWECVITLNPKNRLGAYVGKLRKTYCFRHGKIIAFY